MQAIGKKTECTAKALSNTKTGVCTEETFRKARSMETGISSGQTIVSTEETINRTRSKDTGYLSGQTVANTLDSGRMGNSTEKVSISHQMAIDVKVNGSKVG